MKYHMCATSSTSLLVLVRSGSRMLVASGSRLVCSCLSRCFGVGRAGGLASPCPFLGAANVVVLLASVRGFRGPGDKGLGIPWPLLGCPGRVLCASRRSELGGLFFPLSVISQRVLYLRSCEKSHVASHLVGCCRGLFGSAVWDARSFFLWIFIGFVLT